MTIQSNRSFLMSFVMHTFFILAVLAALLSIACVATYIPLEDMRLSRETPEVFDTGWFARTEKGIVGLESVSRPAADCVDKPLTLENTLPDTLRGQSSLLFQTKNESVRVWVGDELVYTYGEVPQRAYGFGVGAVWNIAPLPDSGGGKAVTVELTPIGGRTGLAPYRFMLGSRSDEVVWLLQELWLTVVVCILLLLIGLGSMGLSLFQRFSQDKSAAEVFAFSLFVLFATVWMAADSGLLQFIFCNKGVAYMLFGCSFYLLFVPFAMFMAAMLPEHKRLFDGFAIAGSAYALARILMYATGMMDFETGLWLLHLLMASLILCTNVALWLPVIRTKHFERRELCQAVSVFTLLECVSLVSFYAEDKMNMLRNGYSSGFYVGIFVFVVIIAVGAARTARALRQKAFQAEFYKRRAYMDDLTGLLTTKGFDDKCAMLLTSSPADRCYAVLDFDVNFFSQYNANNGLDAGDELLRKIAASVREVCKPQELCARQEADHFVCLLYGSTFSSILERIYKVDKDVRERMSARMLLLSYGLTEVTDRRLSPATIRNQALVAKRTIKGNYETNIAVYDHSLHDLQLQEMALLSGFESALQNHEYVIFLQPKIDALTEELRGAEALVRRILPDGSVMSAGSIIETLERKGFVAKLDFYILEQVCQFLCGCIEAGRTACPVSCNFSRVHLYDPAFPARVAETVDRYQLKHELVEIELTETAFLVGKYTLQTVVHRLHEYGFRVDIDDFGSGYSSLNMLKDVEVDVIKLDREFLTGCTENGRASTVIEHTLRLAQNMGIISVAEGIETAEQLAFVRRYGCNVIQGFYYSHPLPADEFVEKYLPL